MSFQSIVDNLVYDTLHVSLPLFRPELALGITIVVLLLVKLLGGLSRIDPFVYALAGCLIALILAIPHQGLLGVGTIERTELFTGMLVYDALTAYSRLLLLTAALITIVLSRLTGLADRLDGQDYYVLLLGATLGMCVMVSSNHLLAVVLGVEMTSVPSYVLAGMVKSSRRAGEAALKFAVCGAATAGIMLYGTSLIAGLFDTLHLPTLSVLAAKLDLADMAASGTANGTLLALALGVLMIGVGLGFKLLVVPFHFWCPDVFEGATAEVAGFLSVAPKVAALVLLLRLTVGVVPPVEESVVDASPTASVAQVADAAPTLNSVLPRSGSGFLAVMIAIAAGVTCTFGNIAALAQSSIKRLLAYSTIAHAGYMLMAVAAALALDAAHSVSALQALLIYLATYLFMNLGIFTVVAVLRVAIGSESLSSYGGLVRQCPLLTASLVVLLVGLLGLPPLAGWIGKFTVLMSLAESSQPVLIVLLIVAALNTVISAGFYINVVRIVCIAPEPISRGPISIGMLPLVLVLLLALPVVLLGVFPGGLTDITASVAQQFVSQ